MGAQQQETKPVMAERFDVVIGGSGMGGLTAGALLAARGYRVVILEREPVVGGYISEFRRGPYVFDSAASFVGAVTDGGEVGNVLEEVGLAGRAQFVNVTRKFRLILPDREVNTREHSYPDAAIAAFPEYRRPFERLRRLVDAVSREINRFEKLPGWLRPFVPLLCPRLFRYARATVGDVLDRELLCPALRALAANLPSTAPPSEIAFLFGAVVHAKGERGGLHYPVGGIGGFARLLAQSAETNGAQLRTREALAAIEHDGRRVRAVRTTSGDRIETRAVGVNFNPADALALLEGPAIRGLAKAQRRTEQFRYSASAFIVYLGLDDKRSWSDEFFFTTIFETDDLEGVYRTIARGQMPDESVLHVTFPSASGAPHDDARSPTAKIIAPAPYDLFDKGTSPESERNYERRKAETAERLIERASRHIPALRAGIVVREVATPHTLEQRTGNRRGAMYGLEPTPDQFGPWRWPNRALLRGLYFCGHYSRPSPGIAGTCYSGRFAAECVTRDLR